MYLTSFFLGGGGGGGGGLFCEIIFKPITNFKHKPNFKHGDITFKERRHLGEYIFSQVLIEPYF